MSNVNPTPKVWLGPMTGSTALFNTRLSLVHPFHGEEKRFKVQLENWINFSPLIKDSIDIILVDDYGTPSLKEMIEKEERQIKDLNISCYRILEDLRYNTPGSLNLGVMVSKTPWVLIMDSDCLFSPEEIAKLILLKPMDDFLFKFNRIRITDNLQWKNKRRYLPCTMLFNKQLFLDINGFDEDFTGERSGGYAFFDNHFDRKALDAGYFHKIIPDITALEYMPDSVGNPPKGPISKAKEKINRKLLYGKIDGDIPLGKQILRFPWECVYKNVR